MKFHHKMKPYRRTDKAFRIEYRGASRLRKAQLLVREFGRDVHNLWRFGAPFPTFLKMIATLALCLVVVLPLLYPVFLAFLTYFTFESLFVSWWFDRCEQFSPRLVLERMAAAAALRRRLPGAWKVREVLTRGLLLAHSLATSVDYLCVMQGLLEDV